MIKLAKVANKETKACDVALGTNEKFYKSLGFKELDVEQDYKGNWYLAGFAPKKPHKEEIQDQINALENQITERNLRSALIGDEFAINKIKDIEMQIDVLREQLKEE